VGERGIVDLRVVGQRDEGGVAVDAERRQRLVRPFGDDLHVGEALDRGEGGARVDDGHVIAEEFGDRRQRLADMHGAGDDELRRGHVDGEKNPALRRLLHAALAGAQVFGERRPQRIPADVGGLHQPLRAALHVGDDDRRAARGTFGIEGSKEVELHQVFSVVIPEAERNEAVRNP
jgi:hypothetical protein